VIESSSSEKRRAIHRIARRVHWAGNLTFGLFAALQPQRAAVMMGESEEQVRAIAIRDLRAGLRLLAASDPLWPLLAGLRADAVEALGWLRRNPRLALFPMLWCALALVAILTRD
jgi:hypothetical protein